MRKYRDFDGRKYYNLRSMNFDPNKGDIIKQFNSSVQVPTGLVDIQIGDKITSVLLIQEQTFQ